MPVDPEIQGILDFVASRGVPPHYELTPEEARVNMRKGRAVTCPPEPHPLARVEDARIPRDGAPGAAGDISVRLYAAGTGGALPVLVFYHGGGWVMGDLDTHDDACRRLADLAGCLVVSVDYRLAPEHRFPAAVEDAYAALAWVGAHAEAIGGDPARIAVAGDSAGGNLSAVVAQIARDTDGPKLALQGLIYPVVDCDAGRPSYSEHAEGYLLTMTGMAWFWEHYVPAVAGRADPRASPLRADSLAGLPPAYIQLAGYDLLLDEGEAYAAALQAAGVPVTVQRYPTAIHGFYTMTVTEIARTAIADTAQALRAAFG